MENASPMGLMEKTRFKWPIPTPITPLALDPLPCMAFVGNEDTMRLACKVEVLGDMEVETGPRSISSAKISLVETRSAAIAAKRLAATRSGARQLPMKQIIAIVKPFLVEKILDALRRAPLEALSVMEVKGMGKQKSYLDATPTPSIRSRFFPRSRSRSGSTICGPKTSLGRSSKSPAPAAWATARSSSCRPNPAKP